MTHIYMKLYVVEKGVFSSFVERKKIVLLIHICKLCILWMSMQ